MSSKPLACRVDRDAALTAFRLGAGVVLFREGVESAYLEAWDDPEDPPGGRPRFPRWVDDRLSTVLECARHLEASLSPRQRLSRWVGRLVVASQGMRGMLGREWQSEDHRRRLERRRAGLDASDGADGDYCNYRALSGSAFAGGRWARYKKAVRQVSRALPSPYRELFDLAGVLATVEAAPPSDYDPAREERRALDPAHVRGVLGPRVTRILRDVRQHYGLLEDLPDLLAGEDARLAAVLLRRAIGSELRPPRPPSPAPPVPGPAGVAAYAGPAVTGPGEPPPALAGGSGRQEQTGRAKVVVSVGEAAYSIQRAPRQAVPVPERFQALFLLFVGKIASGSPAEVVRWGEINRLTSPGDDCPNATANTRQAIRDLRVWLDRELGLSPDGRGWVVTAVGQGVGLTTQADWALSRKLKSTRTGHRSDYQAFDPNVLAETVIEPRQRVSRSPRRRKRPQDS